MTDEPPVLEIAARFAVSGRPVAAAPLGEGLIHATFRVRVEGGADLVLQRMHEAVLRDVGAVMGNIRRVCAHLAEKVAARGGDPRREALTPLPVRGGADPGAPFVRDAAGHPWRAFFEVAGARTYQVAEPARLEAVGAAFARFQADLADLPGPPLAEPLPGFHDTPARLADLEAAAADAPAADRAAAADELAALRDAAVECGVVATGLASGALPTRVCHYDTKLNNVLFDAATDRPLCVIDLDTVMPGSVLYDFADAARFAACTVPEDHPEPGDADLDLARFGALARGYLGVAAGFLTPAERALLVPACRVITLELAARFLADHLRGDAYFKVEARGQNLRRARVQLALAAAMRRREPAMRARVEG